VVKITAVELRATKGILGLMYMDKPSNGPKAKPYFPSVNFVCVKQEIQMKPTLKAAKP
jgi:hypothetical protein